MHLDDAAKGDAREADVDKTLLVGARVLAAGSGLLALLVEEVA